MKKVLVIGYQPYDEAMFPHTYDVLRILDDHCDLVYFGGDERGRIRYTLGLMKPKSFHPRPWVRFFRHLLTSYKKIRGIQNEIEKLMNNDVDIVIAIDHSALHYACKFLKEDTRLIFWSLDYLSPDHLRMDSFWVRRLVKENQKDVRKCDLIIIQDGNRAAVLDSILNSHHVPKLYLPVSLRADAFSENAAQRRQSRFFDGNIILMQLGAVHPQRASDAILEAYQKMQDNTLLIFKGDISGDILELVEKVGKKPIVQPRSITLKEMRETVSQADVGIIACRLKNLNNYFFSRASGQLVEYLRLGIPVIVLDVKELGEFVETSKCGLSIPNVSQLDCAIQKIVGDYSNYSMSSYAAFHKFFNIALYRERLINEILS
jgi:glycosyltransferase involved in cell wall biosynthesis